MRERIRYHFMFIDIDDEGTTYLMEKSIRNELTWKGKEKLMLQAFDLYGKLIGDYTEDK